MNYTQQPFIQEGYFQEEPISEGEFNLYFDKRIC